MAALALALVAPCGASAAPAGTFTWIASGPGDQTEAAIDGRYVLYADDSRGGFDVLSRDLVTGTTRVVASGPGPEDSPDLARSVVAYRSPAGVTVAYLATGALLREPAEPGARAPAVSTTAAVWEVGPEGSRDIGWFLFGGGAPRSGVIAAPGDQRAPAVSGATVAYVDAASGGAVLVQDLARGEARVVCPGGATGVAIDGGPGALRLAVTRAAAGGADVEVYDGAGRLLAALPRPGEQRNPHLAGDWVAFEDLSSGRSQVVLWAWRTGLVHAPRTSAADQLLSDLSADEDALRVAFSERTTGGLDVGLYTLPLPISEDGTGPARCDDPQAVVLAELALARAAGTSTTGALAFSAGDGADLPILVCVDAAQVTSAWVALDGELVAAPEDVGSGSSHLEARAVARGGEGLLEASVTGKRGAALRVRVLADPARGSGGGPGPGTPGDPGGGDPGDGGNGGGGGGDDGPGTPPDPTDPGGGPGGGADDGGDGPTLPGRGGCATGGVDPLALAGALSLLRLRRRPARG